MVNQPGAVGAADRGPGAGPRHQQPAQRPDRLPARRGPGQLLPHPVRRAAAPAGAVDRAGSADLRRHHGVDRAGVRRGPGDRAGLAGVGLAGGGRVLRALLHLAAEVHRPGRAGGDDRLGAADDRRRLLRHHRAVELACGVGQPALRAGADHRHLRQAHRQARPGQGQGHPHAAGDHRREGRPLRRLWA